MATALAKLAEQVEVGKAQAQLSIQTTNGLNQLKNIMMNAKALKQRMIDGDSFTDDDVSEFQSAIDARITEVEVVFSGIKAL